MLQQDGSKLSATRSLLSFFACVGLWAFSKRPGGDTFAIYLNNKILVQERVLPQAQVKSVALSSGDANGILKIQYSHCGQIGAKRSLTINDNENTVLKTWDFADTASPVMELALPNTRDPRTWVAVWMGQPD